METLNFSKSISKAKKDHLRGNEDAYWLIEALEEENSAEAIRIAEDTSNVNLLVFTE